MEIQSLRDLEMAGVQWELIEIRAKNPGKNTPRDNSITDAPLAAPKSQTPPDIRHTASVIPPTAPINLSVARDLANSAESLESLNQAILEFNHPLRQFAPRPILPSFANNGSDLLIITDMPSADDDTSGQILSGGAGELMNKMLSAIDLSRECVSVIPLVFWRTPGGRSPSGDELLLARPFLDRAISLLKPRAILTLGTLSALEIAGAKLPRDHGTDFKTTNDIPVIPIFHPNYLILKPAAKKDAWDALKKLQNLLKSQEI